MADLPAGSHPCPTCGRPIWHQVSRCGACQGNANDHPDLKEQR